MATAKKVNNQLNNQLETAKNQLLALGVLEESIKIENGVVIVLGANNGTDAKVFFANNNGNVHINPNQIKSSQLAAYARYKVVQGNKPCKSFEKWLTPQLENLPPIEQFINKIDAPPASISVVEELHFWSLKISRAERHVQELSAAISRELQGFDDQDQSTMVFLSKEVVVPLGNKKFFSSYDVRTEKDEIHRGRYKFFIKDESFAPVLAKIKAAAAKCGDSFTVNLCYK